MNLSFLQIMRSMLRFNREDT